MATKENSKLRELIREYRIKDMEDVHLKSFLKHYQMLNIVGPYP
jgi:hypothetical protein